MGLQTVSACLPYSLSSSVSKLLTSTSLLRGKVAVRSVSILVFCSAALGDSGTAGGLAGVVVLE